ncbi:hypothetical protein P280DRAFT_552117 [Massarina eburnea CBS 473.64]|uniref:Rhodopsin domain-containing protein n=1 Tax=Massarina eburnea CBS 473.64 TaxID=1395130 RepID=A0A6A6RST4_9PLEO|nr:hypothetical protein P280DRAFT_552117 [Massarina eburnea CBS 473.64]
MADQPHSVITVNDHGPLLAISAWLLGCALLLCTATRIGIRFSTRKLPTADDVCILIATALAIGNTIAISFAVESGLGKRAFLLTIAHIVDISKEIYISTILYIPTVGFSKLSVTIFVARLTCTPSHKRAVILLGVVISCWTISITGVVAFMCKLPRPWDYTGQCIPIMPFWIAACAIDVLTDLGLIVLPVYIVSKLQLQTHKKVVVIFIFALRILLITLSVSRLIFFRISFSPTADRSFDSIPHFILTQAHAALSVIIDCSPALKPFTDNVPTGMLSVSLANHSAGTTFAKDSYNARALPSKSRVESFSTITTSRTWSPPRPPPPPEELRPDLSIFGPRFLLGHTTTTAVSESMREDGSRKISEECVRGNGSKVGDSCERGGITKTMAWHVRFDQAGTV